MEAYYQPATRLITKSPACSSPNAYVKYGTMFTILILKLYLSIVKCCVISLHCLQFMLICCWIWSDVLLF